MARPKTKADPIQLRLGREADAEVRSRADRRGLTAAAYLVDLIERQHQPAGVQQTLPTVGAHASHEFKLNAVTSLRQCTKCRCTISSAASREPCR